MKHLLPWLLLLASAVATGQTSPSVSGARQTGTNALAAPEVASRDTPPGSQPTLEGSLGFRSLHYLFNRTAWPTLPRDGAPLRSGLVDIDLADPLQAIVISNAWHLPAAVGPEDIRVADLRKHVLRSAVVFTSDWPDYTTPGFIVLVQKRNHEWALVARLASQYLVEDRSGLGVCAISSP